MIRFLFGLSLLGSLSISAFADTFKLPENKPVVSFVLPDSWNPTETVAGLQAVSVDGEIYLALEYFDADSVNDVVDENVSFLEKQGVTLEKSPKSEGDSTINDMAISHKSYKGMDKDGPCEVSRRRPAIEKFREQVANRKSAI